MKAKHKGTAISAGLIIVVAWAFVATAFAIFICNGEMNDQNFKILGVLTSFAVALTFLCRLLGGVEFSVPSTSFGSTPSQSIHSCNSDSKSAFSSTKQFVYVVDRGRYLEVKYTDGRERGVPLEHGYRFANSTSHTYSVTNGSRTKVYDVNHKLVSIT